LTENSPAFRALTHRTSGPSAGAQLHLVADGAEASLCGISRIQLGQSGLFDDQVCPDCLAEIPKRSRLSR